MAKIPTHIYNGSKGKCVVCGKLIRHSSHNLGNADYLEKFFAPGNVIWSFYWREYDRVIAFHPNTVADTQTTYWSVIVRRCNEAGEFLPNAPVRTHSTQPDARDRVVTNVGNNVQG
jgi:hypothetical protein